MKKFINSPENYVDEYLEGIALAHSDRLTISKNNKRALCRTSPVQGKVAIVTGGGSGHLPLFLGYVGDGLLDACAVGNVFASPSSVAMTAAAKEVETGAGVLYLFGNYGGDRMNFDMAAEDLQDEGIAVRQVWCNDDVASAPADKSANRRGVAGIVLVYKAAGAAAARMLPLDEVERIARKANERTKSMGVSLSACTLPDIGKPSFTMGDDEMEVGMGIHGEPGISREPLRTADEIAEILVSNITKDMDYPKGCRVALLINLLGGTSKEEGYIIYRRVHALLKSRDITPAKVLVGEFATSMETAGLSLSLMLLDDQLEELLSEPASTPFVTFEKDWK